MKRNFVLFLLLLFALQGFSISDKIRLGLAISPGIAWSNPAGIDLQHENTRFGINYGFILEYWFAKNYGLSTGLGGAYDGCNLKGRDVFENVGTSTHRVVEKYTFNYLELPMYIKLKSNDIKGSKFCAWGQVGLGLYITVSARASFSDSIAVGGGNMELIQRENILSSHNDVTKTVISDFKSNFFDIRLGAGAGFEYKLDEKTSLLVGLIYHNGFANNIRDTDGDPKKEPNLMRFFSLQIGVLF